MKNEEKKKRKENQTNVNKRSDDNKEDGNWRKNV